MPCALTYANARGIMHERRETQMNTLDMTRDGIISALTPRPRPIDRRQLLSASWRELHRRLGEAIDWIERHQRCIDKNVESDEYIAFARKRLAEWIDIYLDCVRRQSENIVEMDRLGMRFNREVK